MIFIKNIL